MGATRNYFAQSQSDASAREDGDRLYSGLCLHGVAGKFKPAVISGCSLLALAPLLSGDSRGCGAAPPRNNGVYALGLALVESVFQPAVYYISYRIVRALHSHFSG